MHDGVTLARPEGFVKMLSYSNLSSLLGIKRQIGNKGKTRLTIEATGFLVSIETVVLRRWESENKNLVLSNELIKVKLPP